MFDTPDFAPLCVGPVIALIVGGLILAIGTIIEKKTVKKETVRALSRLIAWIIASIACCVSVRHDIGSSMSYPLLITSKDVVGTWHLSQASVDYLQRKGYTIAAHELVFKDDGTFHMDSVPNVWGYLDQSPKGRYITGSGTWRIQRIQTWEIVAHFQTINGQVSDTKVFFHFYGLWPPYRLRVWLGSLDGINFLRE